jgi:hypothetical protein
MTKRCGYSQYDWMFCPLIATSLPSNLNKVMQEVLDGVTKPPPIIPVNDVEEVDTGPVWLEESTIGDVRPPELSGIMLPRLESIFEYMGVVRNFVKFLEGAISGGSAAAIAFGGALLYKKATGHKSEFVPIEHWLADAEMYLESTGDITPSEPFEDILGVFFPYIMVLDVIIEGADNAIEVIDYLNKYIDTFRESGSDVVNMLDTSGNLGAMFNDVLNIVEGAVNIPRPALEFIQDLGESLSTPIKDVSMKQQVIDQTIVEGQAELLHNMPKPGEVVVPYVQGVDNVTVTEEGSVMIRESFT